MIKATWKYLKRAIPLSSCFWYFPVRERVNESKTLTSQWYSLLCDSQDNKNKEIKLKRLAQGKVHIRLLQRRRKKRKSTMSIIRIVLENWGYCFLPHAFNGAPISAALKLQWTAEGLLACCKGRLPVGIAVSPEDLWKFSRKLSNPSCRSSSAIATK